jgi:phosphatidylserine/phosphatidylglycerophosphate/cardiolipin synthase-like enzyme
VIDLFEALQEVLRAQAGPSTGAGPAVSRLTSQITECIQRDPTRFEYELREALLDTSVRLDRVSIAVTGLSWLGAGVPSVEQEMLALVRGARREIVLCAYSITNGAAVMLEEITDVVMQGVNATIVVNHLDDQPSSIQQYLKNAAQEANGRWHVFDFERRGRQTDLHAKLLIVDRAAALIGSANLSFHGMVSNHEIAVVLRGPTAEAIAARVEMLTRGASVTRRW